MPDRRTFRCSIATDIVERGQLIWHAFREHVMASALRALEKYVGLRYPYASRSIKEPPSLSNVLTWLVDPPGAAGSRLCTGSN